MTKHAVIYQIYPRSFFDSNGDGVGDLPGIIAKMPYLASLNIDYLWISPFFKSPMLDFGYDVSDYQLIDPLFGTNDDFDQLLHQAERLGIKIMVDMVMSHTSSQHPWFLESRSGRDNLKSDWYVWADPEEDGSPPNNWLSIFGGSAWHWEPRRGQYYLRHFLPQQPALNHHNPEVRARMLAVCKYWLDKGVKGFRLDVIHFAHYDQELRNNPPLPSDKKPEGVLPSNPFGMQDHLYDMAQPETLDLLEDLRELVNEYPDVMLLGEVGEQHLAVEYTGEDKLHSSYFFNFLDYRKHPVASEFKKIITDTVKDFPDGNCCFSFSNHDFPRHVSRMKAPAHLESQFARMSAALMATLPGSICVYQGEELGLPTAYVPFELLVDPYDREFYPDHIGRDSARTPIPWQKDEHHAGFSRAEHPTWLPVPHEHYPLAVYSQEEDTDSTLNYYRNLLAWRREQPALKSNRLELMNIPSPVLSYERGDEDGQKIYCLFNLSSEPTLVDIPHHFHTEHCIWQSGKVSINNGKMLLDAYAVVVIEEAA